MAIIEKLLEPSLNKQRRKRTPKKPQRRFIVYFITQQSSISVWLDHVSVPPTPKRTFHLYVLKHAWRIIECVFRNPANSYRAEYPGFNHRPRTNVRNLRGLKYASALPGRQQQGQDVWLFMEFENSLRACRDKALFNKPHMFVLQAAVITSPVVGLASALLGSGFRCGFFCRFRLRNLQAVSQLFPNGCFLLERFIRAEQRKHRDALIY